MRNGRSDASPGQVGCGATAESVVGHATNNRRTDLSSLGDSILR